MPFWVLIVFAVMVSFIEFFSGWDSAVLVVLVVIAFNLMEMNVKLGGGK